MEKDDVSINYQDMYGNTTLHYAVYNAHEEFIKACIDEFKANLLVVNNGGQSVLTILNERRLALLSNDESTAVQVQ